MSNAQGKSTPRERTSNSRQVGRVLVRQAPVCATQCRRARLSLRPRRILERTCRDRRRTPNVTCLHSRRAREPSTMRRLDESAPLQCRSSRQNELSLRGLQKNVLFEKSFSWHLMLKMKSWKMSIMYRSRTLAINKINSGDLGQICIIMMEINLKLKFNNSINLRVSIDLTTNKLA